MDCRAGVPVVHPRPQTQQGESVAKPETPLLIILGIACKYEVLSIAYKYEVIFVENVANAI